MIVYNCLSKNSQHTSRVVSIHKDSVKFDLVIPNVGKKNMQGVV